MTDERSRSADLDRRLSPPAGGTPGPTGDEQALARFALQVRETLRSPAPRPAFTAAARRQLLSRLPTAPAPRLALPGAVRRLAFAAASVLVAFSLGTAGVAYAAQEAVPGDALYGIKRGLETARWSLTGEPEAQVELLSRFAAERVQEVEALAEAGRDALVAQTLEAYQQTLEQLQTVAGGLPQGIRAGVIAQAEEKVQQHARVLERVREQVPPQAQAAIERALERTSHSQEVLEQLQQGASPSDLAPGQDKEREHGPKRTPGPQEGKNKP
jgi:hypothetical protein